MMVAVIAAVVAWSISVLLTPWLAEIGRARGWAVKPHSVRSKPSLSCLGGLAIFIAWIFPVLGMSWLARNWTPELRGLLMGSALLLVVGLFDDVRELSPWAKLMGQTISCGVAISLGLSTRIEALPLVMNWVVTGVWLLTITNAFNLLDILDGLAAGLAAIAALALLVIAGLTADLQTCIVAGSFLGATLGFLRFNFPPASVFMGDTGSLVIGFILAGLAITTRYAPDPTRTFALLSPLVILGLPLFDLAFVMWTRRQQGRSMIRKSADHFALRLARLGYGGKQGLMVMYALALGFGVVGCLLTQVRWPVAVVLVVGLGGLVGGLARRLSTVTIE